jgi:hypothetical protein
MTLAHKQQHFAVLVARLIIEATRREWAVTFGEAYRSPEEAARLAKLGIGIAHSLHTQRLAVDLNLFINGQYQTDSAAYAPLGAWWEQQSSGEIVCAWGGRFSTPDGNHFSCEHEGRR